MTMVSYYGILTGSHMSPTEQSELRWS